MTGKYLSLLAPMMLVILLCDPTMADSLNVTLSQSTQTVTQGTTVVAFDATISNSSSDTLFLNDAGGSTSDPGVTIDLSQFFANAPISLDPTQSSGQIELFDVDLPSNASGLYSGMFTIFGGRDSGAATDLADVSFSLDVVGSTVTPEPSTLALYAIGLLFTGLLLIIHKRRGDAH